MLYIVNLLESINCLELYMEIQLSKHIEMSVNLSLTLNDPSSLSFDIVPNCLNSFIWSVICLFTSLINLKTMKFDNDSVKFSHRSCLGLEILNV